MFLKNIDTETRQQIDNLLTLYYKNGGGLPVDIELLIASLCRVIDVDIELHERFFCLRNNRGLLMPIENGFVIEVNRLDTFAERRVTVGHEIGHILYSFDYDLYEIPQQKPERQSTSIFPNKTVEQICDEIASYILCPPDLLADFLKHFDEILYQPDLFAEKQQTVFLFRMNFIAKKFGIPLAQLYRYIILQFGKEKLVSLIKK